MKLFLFYNTGKADSPNGMDTFSYIGFCAVILAEDIRVASEYLCEKLSSNSLFPGILRRDDKYIVYLYNRKDATFSGYEFIVQEIINKSGVQFLFEGD